MNEEYDAAFPIKDYLPLPAVTPTRPTSPAFGERFRDPRGFVVEWDGKHWREPASGRIA